MKKKFNKLTKILLVFMTFFSQLSPAFSVLASETETKPLSYTLNEEFNEEEGCIESFILTYNGSDNYDENESYDMVLTSYFTYLDNTTSSEVVNEISVTGSELNKENTYTLCSISKYYNGVFNLNIKVTDSEDTVVFNEDTSYTVYNSNKGLIGSLNNGNILPSSETVSSISEGNYEVGEATLYTQNYILMPGELSPNSTYRIVYADGTSSDNILGSDIISTVIEGTTTDLTNSLKGSYSYTDSITLERIENDTVVETLTYSYNSTIVYSGNDDDIFNSIYNNITFSNGYAIVNAKGYNGSTSIPTVEEIESALTDITLKVTDENGNEVTDKTSEIKNNYKLLFTLGTTSEYTVIVKGDNTFDNTFNSEDLTSTMKSFINNENVLSMDVVSNEEEEDGTITFSDIMYLNESLKTNGDVTKEEEDNTNLNLTFSDVNDTIYVGDTFTIYLSVNSSEVTDYIDGINGSVAVNDNLVINNVSFNSDLNGVYENSSIVASGSELTSGDIVLSVELMATSAGTGKLSISGEVAKYLNISEFNEVVKEVTILSNVSSNNDLSSLNASTGSFNREFDKDVLEYTLTVPYNTQSVILSGGLFDSKSSVDGLIEYTLTGDSTVAYVTVTAEDGSTKTYTINIVKESEPVATPVSYTYSVNNYLKSLEIDNYDIDFDRDVLEYKITVGGDVTSLDIKAVAEDSRSRVEITGNEKFTTGENTVVITVTAEDGSTREYKLIVNKEAEEKSGLIETESSSNTAEKIVIIILIILVVLGLLYLIFKKDDDDEDNERRIETPTKKNNNMKKNKK